MKNTLLLFLCFISLQVVSQPKSANYKLAKAMGDKMFYLIQDEQYDKFVLFFDDTLAEAVPAQKLEKLINQLIDKNGKVQKPLEFAEKVTAEGIHYEQGIQFEKTKFDLIYSINKNNRLSGFRITPYSDKSEWLFPSYADNRQFEDYPIEVGDEMPLLGKFAKPNRPESLVVVVMVHGSGPNDMDESLGPNKIFRDLAYGLASNNIASIRYNKRTYDYKEAMYKRMNSLTIDDIVTNDAVKAIAKARELGAQKVILLGHSLGGHMAPKIAEKAKVDGVILMAGNASPLVELLIPQIEYLMKNDSTTSINEIQYNQIKWQIDNLEKGDFDSTTVGPTLPLGMSGAFWLSLKDYKPQKISKKQDIPYLVLNGDRDYQVTVEEAEMWKNGSRNEMSETIIYPKMNHLFYAGEGILLPSEYEQKSHLDETVLKDIIRWVNSL